MSNQTGDLCDYTAWEYSEAQVGTSLRPNLSSSSAQRSCNTNVQSGTNRTFHGAYTFYKNWNSNIVTSLYRAIFRVSVRQI